MIDYIDTLITGRNYLDEVDLLRNHLSTMIENNMSIEIAESAILKTGQSEEVKVESKPEPEYVEIDAQPVILSRNFVRIDLGKGIYKDVTYEDFIRMLSEATSSSFTKTNYELQLPRGAFYLALGVDTLQVSCYYEEAIKPFSYSREGGSKVENFEIVTPNIIISHSMQRENGKEWVITSSKYMATDVAMSKLPKKFINEVDSRQRIVLMPFTNAYGDCKMCFGENKMPMRFTDNNLRGLDYYYNFLWSTPFNRDLGIDSKVSGYTITDWYYFLRDCAKEKKPFPYNKLYGLGA